MVDELIRTYGFERMTTDGRKQITVRTICSCATSFTKNPIRTAVQRNRSLRDNNPAFYRLSHDTVQNSHYLRLCATSYHMY